MAARCCTSQGRTPMACAWPRCAGARRLSERRNPMTPAQIIAVCSRIAAIIGPDARVYVYGASHYGSDIGITVRPLGYASDREQRTFTAPHWQDMLIQAEV